MAKIAIVGYGKMGKAIEKIALERGNEVPVIIDADNINDLQTTTLEKVDVAIEFTRPESAYPNIVTLLKNKVPVVCGTTGWIDKKEEVETLTKDNESAFFYASNYSVGVNLFFHLNKRLAELMNPFKEYDVEMVEIHHIHKLDAPSGTAITLAEGVFEGFDNKKSWELDQSTSPEKLNIRHKREGEVPGTHIIEYNSEVDSIEIKHTAHSRQGFALGAVLAAEFLAGKKGLYGMNDLLKI